MSFTTACTSLRRWGSLDRVLDRDEGLVDRVLDRDEGRSDTEGSDGVLVDAVLTLELEEERMTSEQRAPRFEGISALGCDTGGSKGGSVGAILQLVISRPRSNFLISPILS